MSKGQFKASEAALIDFIRAHGKTKPHLADLAMGGRTMTDQQFAPVLLHLRIIIELLRFTVGILLALLLGERPTEVS